MGQRIQPASGLDHVVVMAMIDDDDVSVDVHYGAFFVVVVDVAHSLTSVSSLYEGYYSRILC